MKSFKDILRESLIPNNLSTGKKIHESFSDEEDFDPEYDDDVGMAKSNLSMMKDAASHLHDMLQDNSKLPGHVIEKIILATNYIRDARDYMRSEFESQDDIEEETISEKYKPGVDVLTKTIYLDNEEDIKAVKSINWSKFGGIEVKYNQNGNVTFKTAKMKTVARELEKAIDFGATSAADVLDLPIELRR